jgi:hypothetical protein
VGKVANPPPSYHAQIAAIQRLIAVTSKDPRLTDKDKHDIKTYVNGVTVILSGVVEPPT